MHNGRGNQLLLREEIEEIPLDYTMIADIRGSANLPTISQMFWSPLSFFSVYIGNMPYWALTNSQQYTN